MRTQEISHIGPRQVRSLTITKVPTYGDLRKIGIGMDAGIVRDMMHGLGMDAGIQNLITTASVTTPVQFLQAWLPGFVKILTSARKIDDLVGVTTVGSWEDEEVVQGIMEDAGSAVPYTDYGTVPFSNFNVNFDRRTVVRFEEGLHVGVLEEARAGRIRMNAAAEKRGAAALALEIQRNNVGFYGYNAGDNRTYGYLNDPNLPNYVTVAAGASTFTTWSTKVYLEIVADILTAIQQLRTQTQDVVDPDKVDMTLALPTAARDRLSTVSQYGNSVRDWLRETYPRIRIESAPELNGANGGANVFYLYADSVPEMSTDDGRTFIQVVPAKFQVLGVAKYAKHYEEDYSNATAGIICKRPVAVVRYSGI